MRSTWRRLLDNPWIVVAAIAGTAAYASLGLLVILKPGRLGLDGYLGIALGIALVTASMSYAVLMFRRLLSVQRELERRTALDDRLTAAERAAADRQDWRSASPAVPAVPEGLLRACREGTCILFAGAGVAAQGGLPTWRELLLGLVNSTAAGRSADASGLLRQLQERPGVVADLVAARLSSDELVAGIRDEYRDRHSRSSRLLRVLNRIRFAAAFTTNYDDALDEAFAARKPAVITLDRGEVLALALRQEQFAIVKLYGDLRRPETILLTSHQLRSALLDNPAAVRTIRSMFATNSVLFVGTSLDGIEDVFRELRVQADDRRLHYALVPDREATEVESERFAALYGVRLLPYRASQGHPEVVTFLGGLATGAVLYQGRRELEPWRIERVVLRNIGPFEELRLSLSSRWNVIVGNNGVGKSTVLRAIALTLCGDDSRAEVRAQRLLRAGQRTGSIEVHVRHDVFRTDLVRDAGRVTVRSKQVTPLQAGTWAVFGFPPVRGMSNREGQPDATLAPLPLVDDVLPLLASAVDARLDNLKDWLVNTGLRAEGGRGVGSDETARSQRMLETFFKVLGRLMPGLSIAFSHVDRGSWQVMVATDDGVVPVDLLSQGTIAVIGWVGTVLQRLYDIYPDSAHPEAEQAVVLVDEMDAHMHPEWQQTLVEALRAALPRIQVIGTTHSPLIAGTLDSSEIVRMARDEESGRIVVRTIQEDMKGLRADQVLTGPAFSLETTRSPEAARLLDRYADLLGRRSRTPEEQREFESLSREVRTTVPGSAETAQGREAAELLEQWMLERLQDRSEDERQRIVREANRYLAELHGDARTE